jgi:hypothetical protein
MTWGNISSCHYAKHLESNGYDSIIAPDKGAVGRTSEWHDKLVNHGCKYFIQCEKVRDPATGKLSEPKVSEFCLDKLLASKKALIVDDIGTGSALMFNWEMCLRSSTPIWNLIFLLPTLVLLEVKTLCWMFSTRFTPLIVCLKV